MRFCDTDRILDVISAAQLPGPYRIPNYRVRFRDLYTNATPTSPYRPAGSVVKIQMDRTGLVGGGRNIAQRQSQGDQGRSSPGPEREG